MNLLPQASGTRPRLACEISPQAVVAARSAATTAPIEAVARVALAAGAVAPSLKPGNIVDRVAVTAALRKSLEDLGVRPGSRHDLTLIIPDAAVRVLLLDFDALPNKLSEALPIVRFRLKKLLPFDADEAMIGFQIMSTSKQIVRVLAVAIPRDVLSEYETVAREAGFEPGSVIPSTLASLAATDDAESPILLVNAHPTGVTTAIVRSGILLLHRSVDMQPSTTGTPANIPPAMFESGHALPIVDPHATAGEWAAQEALPEHGHNPYAIADEFPHPASEPQRWDASPAESPADITNDIAEAVNVAAAYFEDTLAEAPTRIACAGPLGADALQQILAQHGIAQTDGLRVRELVTPEALLAGAVSSTVPRGQLAGVMGALRG